MGELNFLTQEVIVMRIPPSDQRKSTFFNAQEVILIFTLAVLNALLDNAHIALQLSTREGFEVKVSEAVHAGIPIIASRTGGIPLQIVDGKSGYLCAPGDNDKVAKHLFDLFTDFNLHKEMSQYAKTHVSDEVGTVGNTAAWLYLALMYCCRGKKLKPNGAWLNDLLREECGEPYKPDEPRLPRNLKP